MTDKEKMDKGFNGKTYSVNGIEYDFWHKYKDGKINAQFFLGKFFLGWKIKGYYK